MERQGADALRAAREAARVAREQARTAAEEAGAGDPEPAGDGQPEQPEQPSGPGAPGWYPPALGAWAGLSVLATTLDEVVVRVAVAAVLAAVVLALVLAVRSPAPARPPSVVAAYAGVTLVVAVGAWLLAREVHPLAGAVAAAASMAALAAAYERGERALSPGRPSPGSRSG